MPRLKKIHIILLSVLLLLSVSVYILVTKYSSKNEVEEPLEADAIVEVFLNKECNFDIKTTRKNFTLYTNLTKNNSEGCENGSIPTWISPSKDILFYEDFSMGMDAEALILYSVNKNQGDKGNILYNQSPAIISEYVFLEDDKLAVLNGAKGEMDKYVLIIYDLKALYEKYPGNYDLLGEQFVDLQTHSRRYDLPDVGKDYSKFKLSEDNKKFIFMSDTEEILHELEY